jgi:hypothetical protein
MKCYAPALAHATSSKTAQIAHAVARSAAATVLLDEHALEDRIAVGAPRQQPVWHTELTSATQIESQATLQQNEST